MMQFSQEWHLESGLFYYEMLWLGTTWYSFIHLEKYIDLEHQLLFGVVFVTC